MGQVPGEQELLQEEQEEQEKIEKEEAPLSEGEQLLVSMMSMTSDEEVYDFLASLSDSQRTLLQATFSEAEASMKEAEAMEAAGDEAVLPPTAAEMRVVQIMAVEENRTTRLKKPEALVTKNMDKISTGQRFKMALGLMLGNLWNSISNITWADAGKMLLGMINPITGPKDAFMAIWNQEEDWKASWEADPLGLILRTAVNVSNLALTVLVSSQACCIG